MNPIDILSDAFSRRPATATAPVELARCAAAALTDDAIVANAVQALHNSGWTDRDGVTAENVARTVLGSVGGAA